MSFLDAETKGYAGPGGSDYADSGEEDAGADNAGADYADAGEEQPTPDDYKGGSNYIVCALDPCVFPPAIYPNGTIVPNSG